MLTDRVGVTALPLTFSAANRRPPAALLQRLAQGDQAFLDSEPNRFDYEYISGKTRQSSQFSAEYYLRKKQLEEWLVKLGDLQPLKLRAITPDEIASETAWLSRLISGERPLIYRKIDSLFSPELHLLLEFNLIGVQWFADMHSDGCYHLVLFRQDYDQGAAMASQMTSLIQLRDSRGDTARPEINIAIFMLRYSWNMPLTGEQLNPPGGSFYRETHASNKRRKLYDALQEWLDLGALRQEYCPMRSYARKKGIGDHSFQTYACCDGLRKPGVAFIKDYWNLLAQNPLVTTPCSMQEALEQWQALSVCQRRAWTQGNFARSKHISVGLFECYAAVAAGLKFKGQRRLNNLQANTPLPAIDHGALIHSACWCWLNLTRMQRERLPIASFAQLTGADIELLQKYLCKTGLTECGQAYYYKGHLTFEMLRVWSSFSDPQRHAITLSKYAERNRIRLDYWQKYATLSGLTAAGAAELAMPAPDVLLQKVQESIASPQKLLSVLQQGKALTPQGIRGAGASAVVTADALNPAAHQQPIVTVKQEPDADISGECSWEPRFRLHQQWNDAAPLLTAAANPKISLTQQLFDAQPLWFTFSDPLNALLQKITPAKYHSFINIVRRFARGVIKHDGKNQPLRFARYLAAPLQQFVAAADGAGQQIPAAEGLKIVAACNIPALTIIGAYSGVLLETEGDQSIEYALIGAERSLGRSWTLPATDARPVRLVSGFRNANRLVLVNTNQLPGLPPLSESGRAGEAGNNLAVMFINDLVPVYVAIRAINKGEQLLISYCGWYNPLEIKQESYRTDTLSLIARQYQMPVIIEDASGELLSAWNHQGEAIDRSHGGQLAQPAIILRQRDDHSGYLWYDAVNASGEIIAHSPEHPYDNFWHALASGLFPEATPENIARLKARVAQQADLTDPLALP